MFHVLNRGVGRRTLFFFLTFSSSSRAVSGYTVNTFPEPLVPPA